MCSEFTRVWRTLWTAQFDLRWTECGEFERERVVGVLRSWIEKSRGTIRAGAQGEGEASPGRPRSPVTQAGKKLRARTRAHGAACAAAALDRAP